jgi:hypothetical protein
MIPLPVLEDITDRSGIAPRTELLLPIGVRARQLRVRTLVAGMLIVLAGHRPAHLTRVRQALVILPEDDQRRLGVIAVELIAAPFRPLQFRGVVQARRVPAGVQGPPDHLGESPPRGHPVMQVEHQLAETPLRQPLGHGIDRRAFLGHEQHLLATGNQRPDQVRDRLALARPRRPLDDQAPPGQHRVDRVVLAGIGIQHQELIRQRHLIRPRDRPRPGPLTADRGAGLLITRQRRDQVMGDQLIQRIVQIADHRELGVGEIRQHDPLIDPEPRDLPGYSPIHR